MSLIALGVLGSLLAGAATGLGVLPVLFLRLPGPRLQDMLLGFAAGVMLGASFFSLILPGLEEAAPRYGGEIGAVLVVSAGVLAGALAIGAVERWAPHEHFILGREGADLVHLRRIWLFVIAITLHNFPEGLAVGVGFGLGDVGHGTSLALGIGLQNIPEGLSVALALITQGYGRRFAAGVGALTGLVEPVGGLIGVSAVVVAAPLLPWGLAFAAGAMIFVISHEIIPETHRRGFQTTATAGLLVGLVVMMVLDVSLG